ncbi:MAG: GNAT family N-acetyltransferase [Lachnospiraceae bacterium]|nr:GNAT family N-acetyltransferase [Lachnospiraceae bacterium]
MDLYITADSGNILRIGDGDDSSITLRVKNKEADILSITVPEDKRRQGIGSALLASAESVLASRGVVSVSADFIDSIDGIGEFLEHNGYDTDKGPAIIDGVGAFEHDSPTMQKIMKHKVEGVNLIRLKEMEISEWDELQIFLEERGVDLTCYDLACLDQQISSVIYDKDDRICSVLLGSIRDNTVYLELLLSRSGEDNILYTLATFQTLIRDIMAPGGGTTYDHVLMASCNHGVRALIEKIYKTGEKPVVCGHCYDAFKVIGPPHGGDKAIDSHTSGKAAGSHMAGDKNKIITRKEEGTQSEWNRELARIPMQQIVSWKAPWYRSSSGKHTGKDLSRS